MTTRPLLVLAALLGISATLVFANTNNASATAHAHDMHTPHQSMHGNMHHGMHHSSDMQALHAKHQQEMQQLHVKHMQEMQQQFQATPSPKP